MRRALVGGWLLAFAACQFDTGAGAADAGLGDATGAGPATTTDTTGGTSTSADAGATSNPSTMGSSSDAPTSTTSPDGTTGSPGDTGSGDETTTGVYESSSSSGGPLELAVAEELLVSLNAANGSATPKGWVNEGTLGNFEALGSPAVGMVDGRLAATVSQDNIYRSAANPPATLVEPDSTRTIEVWVLNPDVQSQESVVAWGRRNEGAGSLMVFGYGSQATWGAVNHWGSSDLNWFEIPQENVWHHLVYTFDGEQTRIYVDGELDNAESVDKGVIDTVDDERILLGAQTNNNGDLSRWASVSLAKVRIHAGALTPEQVANNYEFDLAEFE